MKRNLTSHGYAPLLLLSVLALLVLPALTGTAAPPPNTASALFPKSGTVIPLAQVKALIAEDLDRRGYDGERVDTFPESVAGLAFEPGETGYRVSSPNSAARTGPVSFYVETFAGGTLSRTLPVTVWVQLFREQCVTKTSLARGQAITAADVELARVDLGNAADEGYASIDECVGLRVRRTLPAGWTLTTRDLERMPAVKRGQKTTVRYRHGGISAVATVEVKADGWVGDSVPVVNVDSKRGFTAFVAGPGVLEAVR